MNTLLVGINAKYIHVNIAIRLLQQSATRPVAVREFTINQKPDLIFSEIFRAVPDVLGLSCYIWNWELIKKLVPELKKVLPQTTVILGGPEVTYDAAQALECSGADMVLRGEGERRFSLLLDAIETGSPNLQTIPGLTWRGQGEIHSTPDAPGEDMDSLPFIYGQDMEEYEHRILYYETMRGCPFDCQYCLSSVEKGVRFRSLEKVFSELQFFLDHRVRQVKFVDRTFNCSKPYAADIWRYLIEHDNGVSNFHFEIAADLLDDELIELLSRARKGLFQLEIGVQSTNPGTLSAIHRKSDFERLSGIVRRLQAPGNIHLHLDLIAGLPYEDYARFGESFDDLYALMPDQLQLGFLKLLKGSGLARDREQYGIVCREYAPYEVLYTNWISPAEMLRLKQVEELVEITYNSCRYQAILRLLLPHFPSPFAFFEQLSEFYVSQGYQELSQGKLGHYDILRRFSHTIPGFSSPDYEARFQWAAKHDLYSHEKAKKLPEWLSRDLTSPLREQILEFLSDPEHVRRFLPQYEGEDPKRIIRLAHVERYPFDPRTNEDRPVTLLYNYRDTDLLGNTSVSEIEL